MLPSEVLVLIFSNLSLEDIDNVKLVCKHWKELTETSVHLWKTQILQFCDSNPYYKPVLAMNIFSENVNSPDKLQKLCRKLQIVGDNVSTKNYRVRTINCLEAEIDGVKVDVNNSEWNRDHNYKGETSFILNKN